MLQVPSPIAGLEYFPPGMKELMLPLSQQIFLPSNSASVGVIAIVGDDKTEARAAPAASVRRTFAVISAPPREGADGQCWQVDYAFFLSGSISRSGSFRPIR